MARPFRRRDDGSIEASLTVAEVEALAGVARELETVLEDAERDEGARRLFPPAYEDPERQDAYRSMTRDELTEGRRSAIRLLVRSITDGERRGDRWRARLDEDEQGAWLSVLNDLRLVLGTRLEVDEEMSHTPLPPGDTRAPAFNLYLYLGGIQELLIDEMAAGLVVPGDDEHR